MENVFLTSLTTPEVRQLFRQELEVFFESNHQTIPLLTSKDENPVTVKELCAFLGVTEPTIIRWRKKGKIPFIQVGSRVLFQKSKVIEALEINVKGGRKC